MAESTGEKQNDYALPDAKTLQEAGELEVQDEAGAKMPFKTLYTPSEGTTRQLIVFIRHFYCGVRSPVPPLHHVTSAY